MIKYLPSDIYRTLNLPIAGDIPNISLTKVLSRRLWQLSPNKCHLSHFRFAYLQRRTIDTVSSISFLGQILRAAKCITTDMVGANTCQEHAMHDALVPDAISQAMTFKGDRLTRPLSSIPSRSPPAFGIEGSTPLQNFTILLIESDMTFVETFSDSVSEYGFDVDHHVSFSSVKKSLQNTGARLVAIGSVSQTLDNFSICREIRQINPAIPIIWLQSGDDEFDQALMIELGADVRMSRSAHLRVVIAQLKSLRRRHERDSAPKTDAQEQWQRITHGRLQISVASLQLFVDGQPIPLTAGLFTILMCMVNRANEVVPRKDLIRADRSAFSRAIDSQVNRLRNCLGKAGLPLEVIRSARGQGYIFVSEQCSLQPRNGLKPCMPQYASA